MIPTYPTKAKFRRQYNACTLQYAILVVQTAACLHYVSIDFNSCKKPCVYPQYYVLLQT